MNDIILKELSSIDILLCEKLALELASELKKDDFNSELLTALCEDGALCFLSAFRGSKPAFSSPKDALIKLSLAELSQLSYQYEKSFLQKRGD